jgi:hypothetical protein
MPWVGAQPGTVLVSIASVAPNRDVVGRESMVVLIGGWPLLRPALSDVDFLDLDFQGESAPAVLPNQL